MFDWLVYAAWVVIPITATGLGASSTQLGLLQTASTLVYALNCLWVGRMADRTSKSLLARCGCVLAALACLALSRADSLGHLFLIVPVLGLANSLFWPSVESALGSESGPKGLEKAVGLFNVLWSAGKSLGFFLAGWMMQALGAAHAMYAAAASAAAVALFYPNAGPSRSQEGREPARAELAAYRTMGYIANFFLHGVGAVLTTHYFKYLSAADRGGMNPKAFFGLFLGVVFGAQTLLFWALLPNARWTYRRDLLYGSQLLAGAACFALTLTRDPGLTLLLALPLGAGFGFAYASSIYYSLHGPADHGKFSGIHEAVVGLGNFVLALGGGLLADALGDLRFPYWLGAGAIAAAVLLEEAAFRRRARGKRLDDGFGAVAY